MGMNKLNLGPIDFTETRMNGYHAYWPQDPDSQKRLQEIHHIKRERRSVWPPLVALFLMAAGVYGLILVFAEMF